MKYIRLIGDFEKNQLFMGLLYISLSFFGDSIWCSKATENPGVHDGKTKSFPNI